MARRRSTPESSPAQAGMQACPLCGEVVPVGEDGRCDLGHRVFTPRAAADVTQPLGHVQVLPPDEEPQPASAVDVPVAPVAGLAAAGLPAVDAAAAEDAPREQHAPTSQDTPDTTADAAPARDGDHDEDEDEPLDFSGELDW